MGSHLKRINHDFIRMALILFLITALVGGLLAVLHHFTQPVVERSADERLTQSLQELFESAAEFEPVLEYPESVLSGNIQVPINAVYRAVNSKDKTLGYCVHVSPKGYVDVIDMMVSIDQEGAVRDVNILSISESVGIGLKVQTDEKFQNALMGITDSVKAVTHTPVTKEEVQVISGATVSSTAYIHGVNAAVEVVQLLRAEEVQK